MNWLDLLFWEVVLAGAVRLATPLIFAALGEMLTERSGLINLGVNGIMTAGAFAAVVGSSMFGWTGGLLTAAIVGGLYGLLIAFSVIKGGANQIIVGIAIAFVGTGLTDYLFKIWQPSGQSAMFVPLVPTLKIPGLAEMPFFGQVLFSHTLLTYAALALLAGISFYMARTRGGLRLRAVGDDPEGALAEARGALVAAGFEVDYVALADAETLAESPAADRPRRLLAAARMGTTRLIDNVAVEATP